MDKCKSCNKEFYGGGSFQASHGHDEFCCSKECFEKNNQRILDLVANENRISTFRLQKILNRLDELNFRG